MNARGPRPTLLLSAVAALTFALLAAACTPDDEKADTSAEADADTDADADADADSDADSDADTDADATIVGQWVSEGEDISPIFQSSFFDYVRIDADFREDGSYLVVAATGGGDVYELTGSYTADTSTTPAGLVLLQAQPYEATAEGIYQISGEVMQYEVIQTDPNPNGFVAPTPTTGFGTSSGPGLAAGANTQVYRRP